MYAIKDPILSYESTAPRHVFDRIHFNHVVTLHVIITQRDGSDSLVLGISIHYSPVFEYQSSFVCVGFVLFTTWRVNGRSARFRLPRVDDGAGLARGRRGTEQSLTTAVKKMYRRDSIFRIGVSDVASGVRRGRLLYRVSCSCAFGVRRGRVGIQRRRPTGLWREDVVERRWQLQVSSVSHWNIKRRSVRRRRNAVRGRGGLDTHGRSRARSASATPPIAGASLKRKRTGVREQKTHKREATRSNLRLKKRFSRHFSAPRASSTSSASSTAPTGSVRAAASHQPASGAGADGRGTATWNDCG